MNGLPVFCVRCCNAGAGSTCCCHQGDCRKKVACSCRCTPNISSLVPRDPHHRVSAMSPQILLVAKKEDIAAGAAPFDAFKAAAVANKGKVVFVTVDASGASKDPVMNFFGVKEEDVPAVSGHLVQTSLWGCVALCSVALMPCCRGRAHCCQPLCL
jgi:hypothetical protein